MIKFYVVGDEYREFESESSAIEFIEEEARGMCTTPKQYIEDNAVIIIHGVELSYKPPSGVASLVTKKGK